MMSKDDDTNGENRNGDSLVKLLQRLQLPYIRTNYHELAQTAVEQAWGHLDYLQRLIEGELARREDKSLERIAVVLVLDRHDLLQDAWGSMLEAVHRLGPEWTQAALRIQRHGWLDEA
jgi:hypothetical protein